MHVLKGSISTVGLLGMVVCGCSGGPESSPFSALSLQQSSEEEGPPPDFKAVRTDFSDYELPERTIACPTDNDEYEVSTAKLYYPAVIDAEIARFPALRDAVGSDKVETCEQARRWSSARITIVLGEIPSDELPPPEPDHDTPPVIEKIWQGLNHSDDSQPGFWYTGSTPTTIARLLPSLRITC